MTKTETIYIVTNKERGWFCNRSGHITSVPKEAGKWKTLKGASKYETEMCKVSASSTFELEKLQEESGSLEEE